MTKKYTTTCTAEINFDNLVNLYGLPEGEDLKQRCEDIVDMYIDGLEEIDYRLLAGHKKEISHDLYNYIQSKSN